MISKVRYKEIMLKLKEGLPTLSWSPGQHTWLLNEIKDDLECDLVDTVHDLIGKRLKAPPPIAILEGVKERRNRIRKTTTAYHALPPCDKCDREGFVYARNKEKGWRVAFRCDCPAGDVKAGDFDLWVDGLSEGYDLLI